MRLSAAGWFAFGAATAAGWRCVRAGAWALLLLPPLSLFTDLLALGAAPRLLFSELGLAVGEFVCLGLSCWLRWTRRSSLDGAVVCGFAKGLCSRCLVSGAVALGFVDWSEFKLLVFGWATRGFSEGLCSRCLSVRGVTSVCLGWSVFPLLTRGFSEVPCSLGLSVRVFRAVFGALSILPAFPLDEPCSRGPSVRVATVDLSFRSRLRLCGLSTRRSPLV